MGPISDGSESEPASSAKSIPPAPHFARLALVLALGWSTLALPRPSHADTLDRVRTSGRLRYGADEEGGAPYFYKDADGRRVGFEADLMGEIGRELGVETEFQQAQWETLLQVLGRGEVDIVINGYELTEARTRDCLATRPYYFYQLQLMARADGPVHSLADFELPRPGGGPWKIAVLGGSAADAYARKFAGEDVEISPLDIEIYRADGATNAMRAVRNRQFDATLQDLPAARHYIRKPDFRDHLALVGPPEGGGYYVIYTRKGDERLRDSIDRAIVKLVESGRLRAIYEKHDIWNDAQKILDARPPQILEQPGPTRPLFDVDLLLRFGPSLLLAALTTIVLSFTAMPLAMTIGLLVAIGRVYGPKPLAKILGAYVELVRGTPLILQLYLLFYVLPELGITLTPWAAGVAGLAINYSAYEAEIWRAGLQAIPKGQMEAALALGMSPALAIRRVIVPQALRIAIPPITSDFIAMFKDTSVCSVIMLTELTKQYSILFNSQGGVVEFGLATAALYMAMSLPLSGFSRWVERRMDARPRKGVVG
jgi:polar amino acid transport system substrate-binding protein